MFMLAALAFGGAQFAGNAMGAFGAKQAAAQNDSPLPSYFKVICLNGISPFVAMEGLKLILLPTRA